jgi:hypothetical protein
MSIFVESLKRLYTAQSLTLEKLQGLKDRDKVTQDEYDYIVG